MHFLDGFRPSSLTNFLHRSVTSWVVFSRHSRSKTYLRVLNCASEEKWNDPKITPKNQNATQMHKFYKISAKKLKLKIEWIKKAIYTWYLLKKRDFVVDGLWKSIYPPSQPMMIVLEVSLQSTPRLSLSPPSRLKSEIRLPHT